MSEFPTGPAGDKPETPETLETIGLSEEIRGAIEAKFGFKIPPEKVRIRQKDLDLLNSLEGTGDDGHWKDRGGKIYMEKTSTVNTTGEEGLFIPPFVEVLYSDELEDVTSVFR